MRVETWMSSVKKAWQDPFMKIMTVLIGLIYLSVSSWLLIRVYRAELPNGGIVFHYNSYVGIDQLADRIWIWAFPFVWGCMLILDVFLGYIWFREHTKVSYSLLITGFIWSLMCSWFLFTLVQFSL